jgi:hypothetical protein
MGKRRKGSPFFEACKRFFLWRNINFPFSLSGKLFGEKSDISGKSIFLHFPLCPVLLACD